MLRWVFRKLEISLDNQVITRKPVPETYHCLSLILDTKRIIYFSENSFVFEENRYASRYKFWFFWLLHLPLIYWTKTHVLRLWAVFVMWTAAGEVEKSMVCFQFRSLKFHYTLCNRLTKIASSSSELEYITWRSGRFLPSGASRLAIDVTGLTKRGFLGGFGRSIPLKRRWSCLLNTQRYLIPVARWKRVKIFWSPYILVFEPQSTSFSQGTKHPRFAVMSWLMHASVFRPSAFNLADSSM